MLNRDKFYGAVFGFALATLNQNNEWNSQVSMFLACLKSLVNCNEYNSEDLTKELDEISKTKTLDLVTTKFLEQKSTLLLSSEIPHGRVLASLLYYHDDRDMALEVAADLISLTHEIPKGFKLTELNLRIDQDDHDQDDQDDQDDRDQDDRDQDDRDQDDQEDQAWKIFKETNSFGEGLQECPNEEVKEIYGQIAGFQYGLTE